jgi:hypothetical protein
MPDQLTGEGLEQLHAVASEHVADDAATLALAGGGLFDLDEPMADPAKDLTVIVLTQRMFESAGPPAAHDAIQAAAYAAVP